MRSPRLTEFMSKMEPNSVAIIFSAPEVLRNADTDYEFRQDSDFYALTRTYYATGARQAPHARRIAP